MNELTEIILKEKKENETTRKFLERCGVTSQKFYNWKNGTTPEDKILAKISEVLNIDFLLLASLAKSMDNNGDNTTRREWRKIYNNRKSELSIEKEEKRIRFERKIKKNLE